MADLNLFIPMTKVDMQKRQVWGRATQEVLDGAKEIFDYESSIPFFQRWSESVQKRSQGKSKGNLRAMHQPIAAGKLIAINFNDAEKAIDIGTFVSDDKEWDKCVNGTYTGFSVGGRYAKRWPDAEFFGATRYTADPNEISLVDAPQVDTAVFELIKTDGTSELHKFDNIKIPGDDIVRDEPVIEQGDTEGALLLAEAELQEVESEAVIAAVDPNNPKAEADLITSTSESPEGGDPVTPDWMGKFKEMADKLSASIDQFVEIRKQEADRMEKVTAELKLRGERVGITWREGSPLAPPQGYPSAWQSYGDPVHYAFPMEKALAGEQIAQYNLGKGRENYAPREWMVLGRRMARLASDVFGVTYKFSPTDAKVERNQMEKQMSTANDLQKKNLAQLLDDVQSQLTNATRLIGTDPAAAMSMLTQAQAAIDVASNVSPAPAVAKVDASAVSVEEKCSKCGDALTKDASFCAKCGTKIEKIAAPADPILAAIAQQTQVLEALNASITKMSTKNAHDNVLPPIGDLNSIVDTTPADVDPVIKALGEGDLRKAFEEVGNDQNKLYERVNELAVKAIFDQGINVGRYGVYSLPAQEG